MPRTAIPQSQNLISYSEDFTQGWGAAGLTVVDATTLRDTIDGAPTYHYIGRNFTSGKGVLVTASFSAKAGTKSWINFDVNSSLVAYFNLTTGALGTFVAGYTGSIVPDTDKGAGWWRCTVKYRTALAADSYSLVIANGDLQGNYQGNGTGTIQATKMQLTRANWAGPYVQTGAAVVNTGNIRNLATPVTPVNILVDGDMEAAGTAAYSAFNGTLSKSTAFPHGGSQALRVSYDGSHNEGLAYQNILVIGKRYRIIVWARGDGGSAVPVLADGTGGIYYTFTSSSVWQRIDITIIATSINLCLDSATLAAGRWVEFDDVQAIDLTATPTRQSVVQAQNLLTYSEDFSSYSGIGGTSVAQTPNSGTAPDGTNTMTKITPSNQAGNKWFFNPTITGTGKEMYTLSIFAKAAGYNFLGISVGAGAVNDGAFFNLSNGTLGTVATGVTAKIENMGGNIYRCSITRLAPIGQNYSLFSPQSSDGQALDWTGNGTDGILVWGAQRVTANQVGVYTKTTGSAVNTGGLRNLTSPVTPVNILVDGNMEATNAAVNLVDGNMEAVGTAAWSPVNSATLTKESDPRPGSSGTKSLRVAYNGVASPAVTQVGILIVGHIYRIQGWGKSTNAGAPPYVLSLAVVWLGAANTNWQSFDATFAAGAPAIYFASDSASANYTEWDDITITDVTAGAYTPLQVLGYKVNDGTAHSDNQFLRVAHDGINGYGYELQVVLTLNKPYLVTGWMRGDGSTSPRVLLGGVGAGEMGTVSTAWQRFNFTTISDGTGFFLGANPMQAGGKVDFDDIQVINLTATPMRQPIN